VVIVCLRLGLALIENGIADEQFPSPCQRFVPDSVTTSWSIVPARQAGKEVESSESKDHA
jgi:hypothetical protein